MNNTPLKRNWDDICGTTDYATAQALIAAYSEGQMDEVRHGLEANLQSCVEMAQFNFYVAVKELLESIFLVKYVDRYQTQSQREEVGAKRNKVQYFIATYEFITHNTLLQQIEEVQAIAKNLAAIEKAAIAQMPNLTVFEVLEHPCFF